MGEKESVGQPFQQVSSLLPQGAVFCFWLLFGNLLHSQPLQQRKANTDASAKWRHLSVTVLICLCWDPFQFGNKA